MLFVQAQLLLLAAATRAPGHGHAASAPLCNTNSTSTVLTGRSACSAIATRYHDNAGAGLEEFAARLQRLAHGGGTDVASKARQRVIRILVMGNSVARWNKFLASHVFRRVLHGAFPTITFEVNTGSVEGGFGPSHQLYCGRGEWKDADVFLVHFAELSGTVGGRDLLEQLMALPHRPLVVVIKHCSLAQLEVLISGGVPNSSAAVQRSVWFRRDKHHFRMQRDAEGMQQAFRYVTQQANFERGDTALARSMNATLIDSCALLRTMLPARPHDAKLLRTEASAQRGTATHVCGSGGHGDGGSAAAAVPTGGSGGGGGSSGSGGQTPFEQLASRMFPFNAKQGLGDPLHPTPEYSELQGCAAARMVLAARHLNASIGLRAAAAAKGVQAMGGAATTAGAPAVAAATEPWCLRAGDARFGSAIEANAGWSMQSGGAGGSKQWLQARAIGAFVQLRLRITSHRLTLEYYKHDTLPSARRGAI